MSLTSYRAAPSRDTGRLCGPDMQKGRLCGPPCFEIMNGFFIRSHARASMPGDALLFQCLSNSTIGADWFHGRVRDGIGWVTDAMVTKQ
jgi:hypothetical protein